MKSIFFFFFARLVLRKALKVFFYVGDIPTSRVGEGVSKPKSFTESVLGNILGQMLLIDIIC